MAAMPVASAISGPCSGFEYVPSGKIPKIRLDGAVVGLSLISSGLANAARAAPELVRPADVAADMAARTLSAAALRVLTLRPRRR